MLKIKRLISLFLSFLLLVTVCGCKKNAVNSDNSSFIEEIVVYEEEESSTETVTSDNQASNDNVSSEPEESKPESSKVTESEDNSSKDDDVNIDKTIPGQNALAITMYHFNLSKATNYDGTGFTRFDEIEDIFYNGYCNNIIIGVDSLKQQKFTDMLIKYNVSFWISAWSYFDSQYTTIENYVNQFSYLDQIRDNKQLWDLFLGFHYDENIWRGQSNADFLTMTKAFYEKYGKRNFPVFATGEFTGYEGNQNQIDMDAANMKKINPAALKYVTDVAFDSYSVDVRDGYSNGTYIDKLNKTYPNITDGKSYYSEYTKILLALFDHDVNVWYFPCAYTTSLWSGGKADEAYCVAHLKYLANLLKQQKYQGGICLYTYQSGNKEKGLSQNLVVKTKKTNEQILFPQYNKWKIYSTAFKDITTEFRKTQAPHAPFNFN